MDIKDTSSDGPIQPAEGSDNAMSLSWAATANASGHVGHSSAKCTVAELAYRKHLSADFLRGPKIGLHDHSEGGVDIPYYGRTGEVIAVKRRTALKAKDGSSWPKGKPLAAYGEWRLDEGEKAGELILVEGESDCWTLWFHGFPALGIPGANASKTLLREHIEAVEKIYVSREPDKGGDTFVDGIVKRLEKLGWLGQLGQLGCECGVFELRMPDGIKDPSELHIDDPERFKERLADAIKQSTSLAEPELVDEQDEPTLNGVACTPPDALTDISNAKRFVRQHGDDVRYCHRWAKWLCWDGLHWHEDDTGKPMRLAKRTAESILLEVVNGELTGGI
jgi:putative DNA primase/helicase